MPNTYEDRLTTLARYNVRLSIRAEKNRKVELKKSLLGMHIAGILHVGTRVLLGSPDGFLLGALAAIAAGGFILTALLFFESAFFSKTVGVIPPGPPETSPVTAEEFSRKKERLLEEKKALLHQEEKTEDNMLRNKVAFGVGISSLILGVLTYALIYLIQGS